MRSFVRRLAVPALGLAVLAAPLAVVSGAQAAPVTQGVRAAVPTPASGWKPRGEDYPTTVTTTDLPITMSDGTVLRGDLMRPSLDGKTPVGTPLPVVVTITAYNKTATAGSALAGGAQDYLVKRGYAQLTVDARGTGDSAGQWCAFCTREDKDSTEVLQWAHNQPWSNGATAMRGPSYMGINQIFAAAGHPDGLKAIFPQVPAGDVYRDVVASGGQLDVGFIPAWLGLVTTTGLIPPSTPSADSLSIYLKALADHVAGALTFTAPLLTDAVLGQEPAYDGDFYTQRSPINVISKVDVPTFLISGEYDLFQRGTPLLFENLQKRGVPTRLVIGPWNHLQASGGTGLDQAGYGSLEEIQLRWFDHYVKGMADPALGSDIAPLTWYEQGTGAWRHGTQWVGSERHAVTYRLSGSATTSGTDGALTTGQPADGTAAVYPIPVAGLCTRSTDQWTAGIPSQLPLDNPCLTDNALNDRTGVVFRTAPVTQPVSFQGPINAHLYVSSSSGDGMLSVAVEDEAPDGTVSRLTAGWQVISFRALDASRSRYLDGQLIQPYHPFTQASRSKATGVVPVDVEVFPTGASIQPGHRLRVAVQAYDVPHLLPPLTDAASTLTVLTLHNSAQYPSALTLPALAPTSTVPGSTPATTPATTAGTGTGQAPAGETDGQHATQQPERARRTTTVRAHLVHPRTRAGRGNRVRFIVTTRSGRPASGRVRVLVGHHVVRTVRLHDGRGVVRLPVRRHAGTVLVRLRYLGTPAMRPDTAAVRWRVVGRR